jgi:hypothetical protein
VKVLPKDPGWHSPTPKKNIAGVRVAPDGVSLDVGWSLWTGNGCSGHGADGRPFSNTSGARMLTTLRSDGSFHVLDRALHMSGERYERSEAYGRFVPDGGYFDLRLRQKLYAVTPSGSVVRCDGRWLKFRARLQQRSSVHPGQSHAWPASTVVR